MLVKKIFFPLTCLGPGKRTGLWTVGCHKHCLNCISEDLQAFDERYQMSIPKIISKIKELNNDTPIRMTISGGEPFEQEELLSLLKELKNLGCDDILVYSGWTFEQIKDSSYNECLKYISVLIDGPYIENLNDDKPLRGSSNQRIIFLDEKYKDEYLSLLNHSRSYQLDKSEDGFDIIGIVNKGFKEKYPSLIKENEVFIKK